ncbi:flavonoid 3'-monooxygenase CYP75B137-like [Amaranthus tricolor]|uniref:flavonoid 3'-monooxygenase CYP75B137-like n=1 Tax=Amaranthus tricolor TaxID=29722 RepID=UPI00258C8BFF|nr:flavonoid 3'-monooxygenase CYP75B137-like [Amaranthus tricolor]
MYLETWEIQFLTLLALIWAIFLLKRNRNRQQPPTPPGPSGLPIFGNLFSLDPELHTYFTNLSKVHGPIYSLRLGTKLCVVISSAIHAKEVLKDHDLVFSNRDVPIAGRVATYGGANIVWSPYGAVWRLLRKICIRGMLGTATLDAVHGIRRQEIQQMIRGLSKKAGKATVNIGEEVFLMVMRVVTEMLWGGTVMEAEERKNIGLEFRVAVTEFTSLLGVPNLSDFFPCLAWFDFQGVAKRMSRCVKWLDEIFVKVIDQKSRNGGERDDRKRTQKDFLDTLLQIKDDYEDEAIAKVPFSMSNLKALLMDMVVGATDTTSNTVELAMAEILKNTKVLKRIQQELDEVVGRDSIVEEHHIYKLPYLLAVMKEALRLHPVVPLLVPHCPSESCIVGGYTIPKGSQVFVNVWAIHRDPSVWSNPLEFDPERFLNAKFDFKGNDFNYLPFGSGRRICAGITMAERMVLYSLASLLHLFDWKFLEGESSDVHEKFGIVLSKKTPLILIPERRLSSAALYE